MGNIDPRTLNPEEFLNSECLLYHGAAKDFSYSHLGEYDPLDTGADASEDYGTGFYTTDSLSQAQNYSEVRTSGRLPKSVVYSFVPYQARMLDVRDKNNPYINGVLPRSFVESWLDCLTRYVEDESRFSKLNEFLKEAITSGIHKEFLDRLREEVEGDKDIIIRGDRFEPGIFAKYKNGLIGGAFKKFMLSLGYDEMIYREAGEGKKAENLTGYVFYNPRVVDTYEGWQKRKSD